MPATADILRRLRPFHTLPFRAADLVGTRASRLGERRGWDWLVYNPITMWSYHRLALAEAEPVMAAIASVFPDVDDYLDVGAGSGAFAAAARRRGRRVVALERSGTGRMLARLQGVETRPFDLRHAARTLPATGLAYSFEVAEHLPAELGERLVAFLANASPLVVFTAAHPGQGGYGHINEQPRAYWRERFLSAGMEPLPDGEHALRVAFAANGVRAPWFYDNLMVVRRAAAAG